MTHQAELGQRLTGLSVERRALLEKLLRDKQEAEPRQGPIVSRHRLTVAPLSAAQQRLWILEQMTPGSAFYVETNLQPLDPGADPVIVERCLNEIVRRHEMLRTNFCLVDGQPMQVIHPRVTIPLPVVDLQQLREPEQQAEIARLGVMEARAIGDISKDALIRTILMRLGPGRHVLLLTMHHLVCDGWSMGLFVFEFGSLYRTFVENKPSRLPELPIQYADYAIWQKEWLSGDLLSSHLKYWTKQLADLPILQLPSDHVRPPVQAYRGSTREFIVDWPVFLALRELSQREGATPFMTLLAAFFILLHRYSGQDDIVVGVPVSNRSRSEFIPLIGFFVNTIVLRSRLTGNPAFRDFLGMIRETALQAYSHEELPFERLVEELRPERDLSRNPLFQVVFQVFSLVARDIAASDSAANMHRVDTGTAKFDLRFDLLERPGRMEGYFEYSTDLFDAATIDRMVGHFVRLLRGIADHPERGIFDLPMLSAEEELQLVTDWNRTDEPIPNTCVHELVAMQAARQPDAIAVEYGGSKLTYGELDRRASALACQLVARGVGPNVPVAVCEDRCADWVIALLAVLKSGGAYASLDPAYPAERIRLTLSELGAPVVLTKASMETFPAVPAVPLDHRVTPEGLAYIIYTSGSTGKPRGVEVGHRSLMNLVAWHQKTYKLSSRDRATQLCSPAFDASVWEIWPYLCVGATVCLVDDATVALPSNLVQWLGENGITLSFLPTPLAEAVLAEPDARKLRLRALFTGGDRLQRSYRDLPFELVNHYGPTENTVVATFGGVVAGNQESSPPIGRPIANVRCYVLDRYQNLVPVGVAGELYLAGEGLARGYFKSQELTSEKFVENLPFARRLYRSGDLVRYRPDGNLEFLGRVDDQVKIRGFRIELGEVEATLRSHSAVSEVVVLNHHDSLRAYVACKNRESNGTLHLEAWRTMFDEVMKNSPSNGDASFNISGWNSSYTGLPIPEAEMREQVEQTVQRVLAYRPERVLEIGCGSGLLLFRLAPHCKRYVGTDFSSQALNHIRQHSDAELLLRTANDFEGLIPGSFDTVVINSVVQYFPEQGYLREVLEGVLRMIGPRGRIFIGDVRSLPMLEAFHFSVELARASDSMKAAELRERVRQRMAAERELVVDPGFFRLFQSRHPEISRVEIQPRRGWWHNELTRFRYDVTLEIGGQAGEVPDYESCEWKEVGRLEGWKPRLPLCVRGIPNARTEADVLALQWAAEKESSATVGDLRAQLRESARLGIEPEALWALEKENNCNVHLTFAASGPPGFLDALFLPDSNSGTTIDFGVPISAEERAYTNTPFNDGAKGKIVPELLKYLREQLPGYMIPSRIVVVDGLPRTPNGKIDRKALTQADRKRPELDEAFVSPRTPTERTIAAIWREILGVEKVGVYDNFFDLGGHSLLLVRLHGRLKEVLGMEFSIIDLFRSPNINAFVGYLEQRANAHV